jgi:thioredoxin reductase/SAM-dependent methyltransferase
MDEHESQQLGSVSDTVDVVVLGGGAAGLTAALNLGRVRRSVAVIDAGEPRNAPAAHVHGYLGREGTSPLELLRIGREEVATYGVRMVEGRAVAATGDLGHGFAVELDDGRRVLGRTLLVATGLVDELPPIPGLRERWGRDVVHCPFCHGWEVRDRPLVVLGTGGTGPHAAQVFTTLSEDITLVVHDGVEPSPEQAAELAALGVEVRSGAVAEVVVDDDAVVGVRLADGEVLSAGAVVARGEMVARSSVLTSLGLDAEAHPMGGRAVPADPMGASAVPGVWVAGNVADLAANVVMSAAAGARAAGAVHAHLLRAAIDRAVDAPAVAADDDPDHHHDGHHHDGHHQPDHGGEVPEDVVHDAAFWDGWYAQRDRLWSGDPSPHLVTDSAGLARGRALDVGAGEGGDAIWLAEQGWSVTAVDLSAVALERGRDEAERRGAEVAAAIDWQVHDIVEWEPPSRAFDLVSVHFLHLVQAERDLAFRRCADAVASGGTLLVVGHHPSDVEAAVGRSPARERYFTAEDLAADLDGSWEVVAAETRPRTTAAPDGCAASLNDAVLVARRR